MLLTGDVETCASANGKSHFVHHHESYAKGSDAAFRLFGDTSFLDSPSELVENVNFDHLDQAVGKEEECQPHVECEGVDYTTPYEQGDRLREKVEETEDGDGQEVILSKLTETRDVGVDAMTQSQSSLSASFEYFDQSPGSDGAVVNILSDFVANRTVPAKTDGDSGTNNDITASSDTKGLLENRNNGNTSSVEHKDREQGLIAENDATQQSSLVEGSLASYSDFVADLQATNGHVEQASQVEGNGDNEQSTNPEQHPGPVTRDETHSSQGKSGDLSTNTSSRGEGNSYTQQRWRPVGAAPRLPPRRPIITNGTLHASLERDVPPPPAFLSRPGDDKPSHHAQMLHRFQFGSPVYFRQDRQRLFFHRQSSLPQYYHHYDNTQAHRHVPYVNQPIPPITFTPYCPVSGERSVGSYIPRPLSDTFAQRPVNPIFHQSQNDQPHQRHHPRPSEGVDSSDDSLSPPPLPPRQPHISRTLDGRPQVHIRPHRIQSDPRPPRPHSFNHYIIDKSKAVASSSSSSTSSSSPSSATLPSRPRSHSETHFNCSGQDGSLPTSTNNLTTPPPVTAPGSPRSGPQRRRLKTRRERSQMKQSKTSTAADPNTLKSPMTSRKSSKSTVGASSPSSKVKASQRCADLPGDGFQLSQKSRKSSNGSVGGGANAESTAVGVCRRPWKDTLTSASVCISGSESSCEDSSGSTN